MTRAELSTGIVRLIKRLELYQQTGNPEFVKEAKAIGQCLEDKVITGKEMILWAFVCIFTVLLVSQPPKPVCKVGGDWLETPECTEIAMGEPNV